MADRPPAQPPAAPAPFPPADPGAPQAWLPVDDLPSDPAERDRRAMERRKGGMATFWDVVLWVDLGLVGLALVTLLAMTLAGADFTEAAQGDDEEGGAFSGGMLAIESLGSLVLLGLIPVLWAMGTRREPVRGMLVYLRLRGRGADVGLGLGLGIAALLAGALVSYLLSLSDAGSKLVENPVLDELLKEMTLPLAFLVAFSAAVGEEILFRGLLLRRLGVWVQAALFGLMHLAYGTVLQIVVPAAMGVVFGLVTRRRDSIIAPIVAHFVFNFVPMALAAALGPEALE